MPSDQLFSATFVFLLLQTLMQQATMELPKQRLHATKTPLRSQKAQTQATLAAMFGAAAQRGLCGLRNTQARHRMCSQEAGVATLLDGARSLAVNNCEEQFQYDRWNCSIAYDNIYFFSKNKVYRETAVMHAIAAAALTHTVSRACAEAKLLRCGCAASAQTQVTRSTFQWRGCGDDLQYGRRFTRRFLQLKHVGDDVVGSTLRHNIEVGIRVTAHHFGKECKCHGMSGSCTAQTCWHRLAPFSHSLATLKTRYHQALISTSNKASRRAVVVGRRKPSAHSPLVYLKSSPTFCNATRGRRCRESDNCATLCCGRGFTTQVKNSTRHCNCRWKHCCYVVQCDTCAFTQELYTCK